MEAKTVFDFTDYKHYLRHFEKNQPRGFRAHLAKLLRVQPSYVSQVMSKDADLTPEQAESINDLLGHSSMAADYFVLLVQHARAGTVPLRQRIAARMEQTLKSRLRLKENFQLPTLKSERQAIYYSSWHYAAVHVAVSIPKLNTAKAIAACLGLAVSDVGTALDFLIASGIVEEVNGRFALKEFRLHLEDDSPFIKQHHSHWRFKTLETMNRCATFGESEHLHYSSVVTISHQDVQKLRLYIRDFLTEAKSRIRASKEERIFSLNLDFFPVDTGK